MCADEKKDETKTMVSAKIQVNHFGSFKTAKLKEDILFSIYNSETQ